MKNPQTLYKAAGFLFAVTGGVTAILPPHDFGMTAVWIAIGVVFFVSATRAKN